jgi:hypothetical protein
MPWTDEEMEAHEEIYGRAHQECELCQKGEALCLRSLCLNESCDLEQAVVPQSEMQFSEGIRARLHAGCVAAWERGDDVKEAS